MGSKVIRVIRPVDNSAEKEYLKVFFRFIGCFLSDTPVDTNILSNWDAALIPENEPGSVDIVLNYFDNDPYVTECKNLNIRRIYCYFDFSPEKRWGYVTDTPLLSDYGLQTSQDKSQLRSSVLMVLINNTWKDNAEECQNVRRIAKAYLENSQGDMFQLLQARSCLRVLTMGEVLKEPSAQIAKIQMDSYIKQILSSLWEMWIRLESQSDTYSSYTRVNAAIMINDVVNRLYDSDYGKLSTIQYTQQTFYTIHEGMLIQMLKQIVADDPEFMTAYLLLACCCKNLPVTNRTEEQCYLQILNSVPGNKKRYAFIWYRIGRFYEKKYRDLEKAIDYYRRAVQTDSRFYQAMFKLGYFAAADGRFIDAEAWLNSAIQAIFCGRSTEPDPDGTYKNWLSLSLKDSQYAYKTYVLLAKISINNTREYSARSFIGRASLAATKFEEATLIRQASDPKEFNSFEKYHRLSAPVWAMWQVLKPWCEDIIRDYFIRDIVRERLSQWGWGLNR